MFKIKGTSIEMTRGDTLQIQIRLQKDGTEYVPEVGDSIRFAMKHPKMNSTNTDFDDTEPLILKSIPIGTMILRLDPEDTHELGFGDYVYDLEITFADGTVDTFIANAKIKLTPEVH